MENTLSLIENTVKDKALLVISHKIINGERISFDEGVELYKKGDLAFLGSLANFVREKKHGNKTFYNRNFHVEPTNICIYSCSFCSYSRLLKHREQGWELSIEQILNIVKKYDDLPVTEVHITGGVIPNQDFEFYTELFRHIHAHRPELHIKALTPVEYHYIFKKAKLSYSEGLSLMKEAGLGSLPGGAEIFDEEIRNEIAGGKCTAQEWLSVHEEWHKLGGYSNATMLYGHIEKFHHRIDHMDRLRKLQDKTGGFNTFIPLKFRNKENEMSHVPESTVVEDLRNYAISRLYLDNFDHIKAYWPMIGRNTAQLSLNFGVDDLDGTIDDTTKIYTMAGSEEQSPSMTSEQLNQLIRAIGREPIERNTLYEEVVQ